jgi:hypothetical protein
MGGVGAAVLLGVDCETARVAERKTEKKQQRRSSIMNRILCGAAGIRSTKKQPEGRSFDFSFLSA